MRARLSIATQLERAAGAGARQAWLWRYGRGFGNHATRGMPRLLVDVSAIIRHDAQTGIQRVVRAVWSELRRRNGNGFELLPVYASSSHGYCYAPEDFLGPRVAPISQEAVCAAPGDKFLGLDLSAHLLPKYRRQLRAWRAHGATVHLIVYDLLPLKRPAWFTESAVNNFRKWFDLVAGEADQAVCISDDVASELTRRLDRVGGNRRPTVSRMRMGADIAASVPSTGVCDDVKSIQEHLERRPAILTVGTIEPRKGYEAAIAAFDHLWRSCPDDSPDLVMVGKPGWKTAELQARIRGHPEFGRRLHWFDNISDEGLCLLYDSCRGLLMASRGEGWGLPLIEAAIHRRHVLARDLPVFREHNLPRVSYFSDDSPQALGQALLKLASIGRNPAPAVKLPTWSESVDELLKVIGLNRRHEMSAEPPLRIAS